MVHPDPLDAFTRTTETMKSLTNEKLDEIYRRLCDEGGQGEWDENGKPVFSLSFYGTEEEFEAMKRKLQEEITDP